MGKKKRLKEIEKLKIEIQSLKKSIIEKKEKQFNDDFETVMSLLGKYGDTNYEINRNQNSLFPEITTGFTYIITLLKQPN